jgi:hypothetical protein
LPDSEFPPPPREPRPPDSALGPLKAPVFRMLWFTWLAANTTMWMNDVAVRWLMTSIGPSPLWVALVQSASTLPVFLLGLPSGALADTVDRRRYFMTTQFWVAGVATILCVVILMDKLTAPLLLALTFANGVGLAMRWPVFAPSSRRSVPRPQLAQALALNGIAMNASRIIGPLVGRRPDRQLRQRLRVRAQRRAVDRRRADHHALAARAPGKPAGREPLASAMRVGVQYVLAVQPHARGAAAHRAVLPAFDRAAGAAAAGGRGLPGGAPAPSRAAGVDGRGRDRRGAADAADPRLAAAAAAGAGGHGGAGAGRRGGRLRAQHLRRGAGDGVAGAAWITVANSLTVAAQMALPDWVRARGMSIYQMALMGSTAVGAALWGQVATWTSIPMPWRSPPSPAWC